MPCIVDGNKILTTPIEDIIDLLQQQLYLEHIDKLNKVSVKQQNIRIQCPIHSGGKERTPSCDILLHDKIGFRNGEKIIIPAGTVSCFACGYKANLVKFVANCLNMSYRKATEWILNISDYDVEEEVRQVDFIDDAEVSKNNYGDLPIITSEELKKYDYIHDYMFERKLTPEIIEKYEVGYYPEEDCLTFPVYVDGRCLFVAKRKVKRKMFTLPPVYPKPIYGFDYVNPKESVYICESIINALTLCSYGLQAVALFGTGSYEQINMLNNSSCRRFIICLDGDDGGRNGTKRLLHGLKDKIVTYVKVPDGKDVNNLSKDEFFNLEEFF